MASGVLERAHRPHLKQIVDRWVEALPASLVQLVLLLLATALIISRRPDALRRPQFWAEDGHVFYQQAALWGGMQVLLLPYAGYLHLVPRLTAALTVAVIPLQWAPLAFTLVAIACQLAPVAYFLSGRCDALVPRLRARLLLTVLALGLPATWEVQSTLTNVQWHLMVLALLVVLAPYARRPLGWIVDATGLLLAGLSGPQGLVLLPVAVLVWWQTGRERGRLVQLGILALCGATQASVYLATLSTNGRGGGAALGASPLRLAAIVANRIVLTGALGTYGASVSFNALSSLLPGALWPMEVAFALVALALFALALHHGPLGLRALILYALGVFTLELLSPPWSVMMLPGSNGQRYLVLPLLAWVVTMAWLALHGWSGERWHIVQRLSQRLALGLLLLTLGVALPLDWVTPPRADLHWSAYAAVYSAGCAHRPTGVALATPLTIPLNPVVTEGKPWTLRLVRCP